MAHTSYSQVFFFNDAIYTHCHDLMCVLIENNGKRCVFTNSNTHARARTHLEGFQEMQEQESLQEISCWRLHWLRFITSGASQIRTTPSAEHVARTRPMCFGANFTSVTDVLLSTSVVLLIYTHTILKLLFTSCSIHKKITWEKPFKWFRMIKIAN